MIFDTSLPKFDIPVDFMAGDELFGDILTYYSKFPCKIKSFIFVMCKEGNIHATINHSEYRIKTGDFVTLLPGTFIQVHEVDKDIRLIFTGFSSGFMEENFMRITQLDFPSALWEKPILHLEEKVYNYYNELFSVFIKGKQTEEVSFNRDALKGLFQLILEQVSAIYQKHYTIEPHKLNRGNEILMNFLRALYENYQSEHSVSFYAGKTGVTLQHFCKTIKETTGNTPSDIINRLLIMDAKAYLKSTSLSVKQIALTLGFKNVSFFFKFFKHHTGMTPQEYREK